MNFGLPYQGSKSLIAKQILLQLPPAKHFYDLFGGGAAISHCASELFKNKWQHIHYNEIQKSIPDFLLEIKTGKYNYKNFSPPFVEPEEFNKLKNENQYIKICWSFGNNGKSFLYGKDKIDYKRSLHNAVVFNQFDDNAKKLTGIDKFYFKDIKKRRLALKKLIKSEQLQSLERLERLERLEIDFITSQSYNEVEIQQDSILYCDPPYIGTADYGFKFDHEMFYKFVQENKHPVFFSEYTAPKQFRLVSVISKAATFSASGNTGGKKEMLYCNDAGYNAIKSFRDARFNK